MAEYLTSIGHQITVICASDDTRTSCKTQKGNKFCIIRLSKGDFVIPSIEGNCFLKKARCITRFKSYRKKILKTILKLDNVDIVEIPEYGAESLYLENLPFPVIIRLHTPSFLDRETCSLKSYSFLRKYEAYLAAKEMKILQRARYITSCSNSLSRWMEKHLGLDKKNIPCIYNPVKTENWTINDCEERKPLSILYAGTVAKEKGIETLISACLLLRKSGIPVTLTIVGKLGIYGENIKKNINSETKEWCRFTGNVQRISLLSFYNSHEISCFPAFWENLPMVCLESMCAGSLVLASSRGGMSEIIEDGKNGFLFPPMNPEILAKTLHTVLNLDEHTKNQIRIEARKRILNTFSTEVIIPEILNYYNNAIESYHEYRSNTLG